MQLSAGTRLGPYEIVAPIGAGGMDLVFDAVHDIAIGRDGSIYVAEERTKRVVKLRPSDPSPGLRRR